LYGNIYDLTFNRWFTPIWILAAAAAFIGARKFVFGFGVSGYGDIFWWILFLGVILVAYYTSLGFCLSYKAYVLTTMISRARLDQRIYHPDGVFGLSFIGDFAFTTAAMFLSGWIFAPLVYFSGSASSGWRYFYSTPAFLLEVFFIFTLLSFVIPIYIVHYKILKEKKIHSVILYKIANELTNIPHESFSEDHLKKFDFARKLIDEIKAMPNWPLRLDTALKFSLVSIVVPVLAAIITALIKAEAGGPG